MFIIFKALSCFMCVIKANECPSLITSDTGFEITIWENEDDYVKAN